MGPTHAVDITGFALELAIADRRPRVRCDGQVAPGALARELIGTALWTERIHELHRRPHAQG